MSISDKCGIFAIYDNTDISNKMINGLSLLQHRGRESAGISYFCENCDQICTFKNLGLVNKVFTDFNKKFNIGIGHVRYSTRKKTSLENKLKETQPIECNSFSLAHNGNIPNVHKLKEKYDIHYETESDTIILVKIIEKLFLKYKNWTDVFIEIVHNIKGVYCLVVLVENIIYAIRDSYGVRPLCIGKNESGYCIASESCALQDYKLIRDIKAGEIIKLYQINDEIKYESIYQYHDEEGEKRGLFCSFEYIYFMKMNTIHNKRRVENLRCQLGYELGLTEEKVDRTSVVLSIPNTAIPGAKGFASAIGLEYHNYITKNDGIGRTFILPTHEERIAACNEKFSYSPLLKDLNIYIVDDSIVRGNTIQTIIKNLKKIGVRKIHLRITAPPVISECYYGIDIPTKTELIAYNRTIDEICQELGATTLKYLDLDIMKKVFNSNGENNCTHCFDGKYDKKLLDW
jgi:amidophosphoribosyltransferase